MIASGGEAMSRTRFVGVLAVGVLGVGVGLLETVTGRRFSRRLARAVTRWAHYQSGVLNGVRYRMSHRQPDPSAEDRVLADRVRSVLGPLEHRLDVPRVHVQCQGHEVLLHGDVSSTEQLMAIVAAVREIPGVHKVQSHLNVGLVPGDSKPSEGAGQRAPSAALVSVLSAAHGGGAPAGCERAAARSVLSTFAAALPPGERRHVLGHFPDDLRALAEPARPRWMSHRHLRHLGDFTIAALPSYEPEKRQAVVESVLGAVRDLVPEEVVGVGAVLPGELSELWKTAIPH
jgi:uncharacterized protein (DUF2267 family)